KLSDFPTTLLSFPFIYRCRTQLLVKTNLKAHACGTCTLSTPPLPTLVGKNDRCSGERVYNTGRLFCLHMHPTNKRCSHKAAKPNEWLFNKCPAATQKSSEMQHRPPKK
ncbi:unnamed protein product, partial [Ectocarpus sp. 12 AP-2014]